MRVSREDFFDEKFSSTIKLECQLPKNDFLSHTLWHMALRCTAVRKVVTETTNDYNS